MARYKLIQGKYSDKEGPAGADGKPTLRKFTKGQIINTGKDLLKFNAGPNSIKFELVEAAATPAEEIRRLEKQLLEARAKLAAEPKEVIPPASSAAPGGQVSSGFQGATSLADGTTVSGPIDADDKRLNSSLRKGEETPGGVSALDEMTDDQLRKYAEDTEIDLGEATDRDEIIAKLREGGIR